MSHVLSAKDVINFRKYETRSGCGWSSMVLGNQRQSGSLSRSLVEGAP